MEGGELFPRQNIQPFKAETVFLKGKKEGDVMGAQRVSWFDV